MNHKSIYRFFLFIFAICVFQVHSSNVTQTVTDPFNALSRAWLHDTDSYMVLLKNLIGAYSHFTESDNPEVEYNYLSYAFANHSQFLALYNQMLEQLLDFVRHRTKQFNKDYYASDAAHSFLMTVSSPSGSELRGQLFEVDAVAKALSDFVDGAFTQLQNNPGSLKPQLLSVMQNAYKSYFARYQKARNSLVTEWVVDLFQSLAAVYNPSLFEQNFKKQLSVPDIERLNVYLQLLKTAVDASTDQGAQIMNTGLAAYADVAGYATLVLCRQAGTIGIGQTIAPAFKQVDPRIEPYNPDLQVMVLLPAQSDETVNSIFQTYNKANQKDFKRYQEPCFVKSQLFLDTINQFYCTQEKIQKIMAQYSFGFTPRPHMSYINPALLKKQKMQDPAQAVLQFEEGNRAQPSQNKDSQVVSLLMKALSTCKAAIDLYTETNNALMVSVFTTKEQMLSAVLSNFQAVFNAFNQASTAPDYTATSAGTKAAYYGQAEQLLTSLTDYLLTADQASLALYVKKLSARAGIMRYASWIKGYVTYYGPYITRYLDEAQALQVDQAGKLLIDGTLQTYLQEIISFFQEILPPMIAVYQDELSFYMSLTDKDEEVLHMIEVLQTAITISIYFNKGLSYIDATKEAAADNYTLAILNKDNSTGLLYLLEAKKKYTVAMGYFEMIDDLLTQAQQKSSSYQASVLEYAPFIVLFTDSQKKRLDFKEFVLLHQASLYASVAQELIARTITASTPASYVGYICGQYSSALYNFLGKSENVVLVESMLNVPSFISLCKQEAKNALDSRLFTSLFDGSMSSIITQKEFALQEQKFELAYLLSNFLLSIGDDTVYGLYEKLINHQSSWHVSLLSNSANMPSNVISAGVIKLYNLCVPFYKALLALSKKDNATVQKESVFLTTVINAYKALRDRELQMISTFLNSGSLTEEKFKKCIDSLSSLETNDALYKQLIWFMQLDALLSGADKEGLVLPDIALSSTDEYLGDLYFSHAENLFHKQQQAYNQGTLYTSDTTALFATIEDYLKKAATYYMQSNEAKKYKDTSLLQTNVKGLQKVAALIPLFIINIGRDLQITSQANTVVQSTLKIPSCFPRKSLSTMVLQYDIKKPLFILTERETIVPETLSSEAEMLTTGSTDASSMLAFALKVYKELLQTRVAGKALTDDEGVTISSIDSYIEEYQGQLETLVAGISFCNTILKASFSLTKKIINGKEVYTLIERNVPLPPFPRFNLDLYSAFTYYLQHCLPLYAQSSNPVALDGQLYIPDSSNADMQALISSGILNTYLLATVPLQKKIEKLIGQELYSDLTTMDAVHCNGLKFADYHDLYTQIQNSYQILLGYYASLEDLYSEHGWSKSPIYNLQAKTYLQLIGINKFFASVGDPTDIYFSVGMNTITNYAQEVISLAGILKNGAYVFQAQTLLGQILERAGDQAALIIDPTFATTNYPQTTTAYPLIRTGSSGPYKWQKAANFYQEAASQYKVYAMPQPLFNGQDLGITLMPDQVTALNHGFDTVILKQVQTWAKAGAFYLATFGYNAFQECRCGIKKDGSFDTIHVEQPEPPRFPAWAYPYPGEYPVCALKDGVTYPVADNLYQGVASQRTALFDTIMKTGLIDSANDSSDTDAGTVDDSESGQASVAYGIMKNLLVWSIYFYTQAVDVLQKLSLAKLTTDAEKKSHQDTLAAYIVKVFSTEPGFFHAELGTKDKPAKGGAVNPNNLPALFIPIGVEKSGHLISGFQLIYALSKIKLSIANPAQFYMHTISYWASLPQFEDALMEPVLEWTDRASLNALGSWLSDLSFFARRFYQYVYLYNESPSQAQLDINTAVSGINQSHFVVSDQYVG